MIYKPENNRICEYICDVHELSSDHRIEELGRPQTCQKPPKLQESKQKRT